ncbi:MAG: ABC transporter permease subunit [Phycisphaerales bacterium]
MIRTNLGAYGEPMLWLTGGALGLSVIMIVGLLALVIRMGLGTFWPQPIVQVVFPDGRTLMGEVSRTDSFAPTDSSVEAYAGTVRQRVDAELAAGEGELTRTLLRTGNYRQTNTHFDWLVDAEVAERTRPEWAMVVERLEWGRFYGIPTAFLLDGEAVADGSEAAWQRFKAEHGAVRDRWHERNALQKHDLGDLARQRERARLAVREVEIAFDIPSQWATAARDVHRARMAAADPDAPESAAQRLVEAENRLSRLEGFDVTVDDDARAAYDDALTEFQAVVQRTEQANVAIIARIRELDSENARFELVFDTAAGQPVTVPLDQMVRAYPPNQLSLGQRFGVYFSRWGEFLTADPRSANSEGGVFPAIIGTVLMTLIMALLVVPFGVTAALYLREYARSGPVVSIVRIAINNLAGVPSIVFGVFGLGFFCYGVGAFIDGGPSPATVLPKPQWFGLLAVAAVVGMGAFLATLASVTKPGQPVVGRKRIFRNVAGFLWLAASLGGIGLIAVTPFFDGFFQAQLPNPTFGKGTLVWASFTLALLTLPVVIVATEEALSAVPNSMREGSYACGASKWQTIRRIVLPRAMPGIMTGMILAMARGAGEVAPLMLVGAVKLAPELPVSASPSEYFGVNRSFMHLGYHIYDLGFKSQNSEAAKPLVFTTTLLLVFLVATLNLSAVWLRSRLRRRFVGMKF